MITREKVARQIIFEGGSSPPKKMPKPRNSPRKGKGPAPKEVRKSPLKKLNRAGRGVREGERIDLTKLNSAEYEDLLNNVDVDGKAETEQKNEDAQQKKTSEQSLLKKVVVLDNIYAQTEPQGDNILEDKDSGTDHNTDNVEAEQRNSSDNAQATVQHISSIIDGGIADVDQGDTFHDRLLEDILDSTMPLTASTMTQTDPVGCACQKCSSLMRDIFDALQRHSMHCEDFASSRNQSFNLNRTLSSNGINESSTHRSEDQERLVTLVRHCPKVKIPLSKKHAISVEIPDRDPQKMVEFLLDCLFTTEQLAGMTSDGKTAGSKALDKDIASILEVYINNKYDKNVFNFDKKLFKGFVNAKCFKARNYIWTHHPELVGKSVRPKMTKNKKKVQEDDAQQKKSDKQSKKKKKERATKHKSMKGKESKERGQSSKKKRDEKSTRKEQDVRNKQDEGRDKNERQKKRKDEKMTSNGTNKRLREGEDEESRPSKEEKRPKQIYVQRTKQFIATSTPKQAASVTEHESSEDGESDASSSEHSSASHDSRKIRDKKLTRTEEDVRNKQDEGRVSTNERPKNRKEEKMTSNGIKKRLREGEDDESHPTKGGKRPKKIHIEKCKEIIATSTPKQTATVTERDPSEDEDEESNASSSENSSASHESRNQSDDSSDEE